jgi:hypothetical protein
VSTTEPVTLVVRVDAGEQRDAEQVDLMTRQLLAEVRELEVDSASLLRAGDPPPAGAKAVETVALGGLVVTLLPTVLPKLLDLVQHWVQRGGDRALKLKMQQGDRSVEVEYDPRSLSPEQLREVLAVLAGRSEAPGA